MRIAKISLPAVFVALFGFTHSIDAVTITNTSTNVVFSDNFENQTAGEAQTTANMTPGALGSSWANVGSNQRVVDNAGVPAPGAFQGTHYLRADRSGGGGGATGRSNAIFTAPQEGETIEIEFAYYVSLGNLAFFLQDSDNMHLWNTQATGEGGLWEFYDSAGDLNATATSLTGGANGVWHTAKYTYTQGSTDLTLTIDGVSEVIAGAVSEADANRLPSIVALGVNSSSTAYFDAVPEPSSMCIAALMAISLVGLRRRLKCGQRE